MVTEASKTLCSKAFSIKLTRVTQYATEWMTGFEIDGNFMSHSKAVWTLTFIDSLTLFGIALALFRPSDRILLRDMLMSRFHNIMIVNDVRHKWTRAMGPDGRIKFYCVLLHVMLLSMSSHQWHFDQTKYGKGCSESHLTCEFKGILVLVISERYERICLFIFEIFTYTDWRLLPTVKWQPVSSVSEPSNVT